ncbi:MAG TPA: hypothetical protein VKT75_07390, partial [Acidobacteriaceae bacterium]|nr:hypothetical protein [Acidobacteriaceae bacterium]
MSAPIVELRRLIQENSRIQKGSSIEIDYVDVTHALADASTRQNHVVFGRRGCGKSLLLEKVRKGTGSNIRTIYINCEDYKHHSFPNVLIEILDAVFTEIEEHLGGWFGKKQKLRSLVGELRDSLAKLRAKEDEVAKKVKSRAEVERSNSGTASAGSQQLHLGFGLSSSRKESVEAEYHIFDDKIRDL